MDKQINISVSEDTLEEYRNLAKSEGISVSELISIAMEQYAKNQGKAQYERMNITFPIGTKDKVYKIAESLNMSISRFFTMCAEEYIKDNGLEGDE